MHYLRSIIRQAASKNSKDKPQEPPLAPGVKLPPESKMPPHGNALRPEVAAVYELRVIRPGFYFFVDFGEIDLRRITLQRANELHKQGFKYLKIKKNSNGNSKR